MKNPDASGIDSEAKKPVPGHTFGTFGGVFTPSILTIFGVIMYMRGGYVTGQAGVASALLILLLAKSITLLTTVSVSAISTNTPVEGGGAYFLISRAMGPEFGGSIGLALFCAQALSVPFYILGFAEAVVATAPALDDHFMTLTLATAAALFAITYVGANWAIRVQYFILALIALSIISFLGGAADSFSLSQLRDNLAPTYSQDGGFWRIFAIYFPAVTGIMAGINMSGDLKDPARSIPRGTFAAVLVGGLVYGLQIVLCGGAYESEELIARPFQTLRDGAFVGGGVLVTVGVFMATISSAMGSFMGAPRVLQAVARDRLFRPLHLFAQGAAGTNEPRRALWLTGAITLGVLLIAGGGGEDGRSFFNMVAAVVTMFFLFTYGMVNMAAFIESVAANPSFRPRYRYYHWTAALAGALGCAAVAMLINPYAAAGAGAVMAGIYTYMRRRALAANFGDARRGFRFARLRDSLHALEHMPRDAKNWRPLMLVLSGNPNTRLDLVRHAIWLEGGCGIVTLAEIIVGDLGRYASLRSAGLKRLRRFIAENDLMAYPEVVVAASLGEAVPVLLQAQGIGPLKPNMVMLGWSNDQGGAIRFVGLLRSVNALGISLVVHAGGSADHVPESPRIDLWWRGQRNGALMITLAHLLCQNPVWANAELRILRTVPDESGREPARRALAALVESARVEATVEVVSSRTPFTKTLHAHSHDATLVFMGLSIPEPGEEEAFHSHFQELLEGLPSVILVHSVGEITLEA